MFMSTSPVLSLAQYIGLSKLCGFSSHLSVILYDVWACWVLYSGGRMLSRTLRGSPDPNAFRDILWWFRVHCAVSLWSWIFVMRWRRPLVSGDVIIPCAFVMIQHLVNEADNNLVRRDVGWVVPSPLLLSCSQNVARLEFQLEFQCQFIVLSWFRSLADDCYL